jgi:hypothetical protein
MCTAFAQQKAVVLDNITKTPLQDVRISVIYQNDTTHIESNKLGEFKYSAKKGTRLFFKKRGYAWHFVDIKDDPVKFIILLPSNPWSERDIGKKNMNNTEFIFNGRLVPQDEWDDAGSMDKDDIANFEVHAPRNLKPGEKNKIIMTSK